MKLIDWSSLDAAGKRAALARPAQRTAGDVTEVVRAILDDVRMAAHDGISARINHHSG